MPVRIESGAEPIKGYRLIERLGGGGFGEVWKAEAPGGLFKAIKFVYGDLGAKATDDDSRADQEFKALNRVKTVHHPFILSLERFDIIDDQLVIVMELADRTIWDRFRECRQQGLPGIPRDELIGYLLETAEALDLMNSQYQLQHLDIKPQNLFLVFNHIKVADFGLVKDLEGMHATVTGGVTPVYAAPETFDGWISRFSDQYSLAIVYQELLTGQRPFSGTTIRQLVLQHLQRPPDLSALLAAERPPIARALSKNPEHRFPTCAEFIQALQAAVASHGNVVPALPGAAPPAAAADALQDRFVTVQDEAEPAAGSAGSDLPTQNARGRSPKEPGAEQTPPQPPPVSVLPQRPPKQNTPKKKGEEPPASDSEAKKLLNAPGTRSASENPESGILRPALVVGLGRMGLSVIKSLRKEINEQLGHRDNLPHVRLLFIDTDPEAIHLAGQGKADGLFNGEMLLARLQRPAHYLKAHEHESWLNSKVLYRIPRSRSHAGARPLGRLALVDNHRAITQRLESAVTALAAPEALQTARDKTGLEPRSSVPRVYLVTSLMGGTGSGMFLDLAYLVRRLFREGGHDRIELNGVFFVPADGSDGSDASSSLALANTYAAFTELNYFSARETVFTARYETREQPVTETGAPFEHCTFVPLEEARRGAPPKQLEENLARTGHFLFNDLFTPLGAALEQARGQADVSAPFGDPVGYDTFASYRIVWPRRQILFQAAHRLCARLVQHWMSKDASGSKEEIGTWAAEQWEALGFRPESLITQAQEHCERVLEQAPERMFQEIVEPTAAALARAAGEIGPVKIAPALQAADSLEKLLGVPEEFRPQAPGSAAAEPSAMENAVQEAVRAMAGDCEQKLSELVVRLFEEPAFRLAGAEELVRQLVACIQRALESQEPLCRELEERTATVYQRLHILLEGGTPVTPQTTPRWFGRRAAPTEQPGAELVHLLGTFAKCRYQSLVLQYVNGLYVRLRGFLSDQMREIGFCRTRLLELGDLVRGRLAAIDVGAVAEEVLLPPGCASVDAVAKQIDAGVGRVDLLSFDKQAQALILKQYLSLVNVCMAASTVIAALMPALIQEAESFLEPRLEGADVAGMYLARYPEGAEGDVRLEEDLRTAHDKAAPSLASVPPERQVCLIAIPHGPAGDRLRRLAAAALPRARLITGTCDDQVLIFRAYERLDPADIDQFGAHGKGAYRARIAREPWALHSRGDVQAWHPEEAVPTPS
jgi:serine/threonine protein kinase